MRAVVRSRWLEFNTRLEGRVFKMYADVFGYITVGVGDLINKIEVAAALPWKLDSTGELAPKDVVREDWSALKQRKDLVGKRHDLQASATRVHLTNPDVDALVMRSLQANYNWLKVHHFPELDSYCADAQMGLLSLTWAYGAGFPGLKRFIERRFEELAEAGDWAALVTPDAEGEYPAKINEKGNKGVIERNARNRACFSNAAIVEANGLDPEHLYWPGAPSLEPLFDDPTPVTRPTGRPLPRWVGETELGLPDSLHDELSEQRRKDILDK